jgi:hypothetical protein
MKYQGPLGLNRLSGYGPLVSRIPPNKPNQLYPESNMAYFNLYKDVSKNNVNTNYIETEILSHTKLDTCTVTITKPSSALPEEYSAADDKNAIAVVVFSDEPYLDNVVYYRITEVLTEIMKNENGAIAESGHITIGHGP